MYTHIQRSIKVFCLLVSQYLECATAISSWTAARFCFVFVLIYVHTHPAFNKGVLSIGVPVLGVCYGYQRNTARSIVFWTSHVYTHEFMSVYIHSRFYLYTYSLYTQQILVIYVHTCIRMYVYFGLDMCTHIHSCLSVYIAGFSYIRTYMHMYMCTWIYRYICRCMYTCMCIYMFICSYMCIYIDLHI